MTWRVPREPLWEGPIAHLQHELERRGYQGECNTPVFSWFEYAYDDCTCGYDIREAEWSDTHDHAPTCYQTRLQGGMDRWWADHNAMLARAKALCAEFGIPWQDGFGCAAHCTCAYRVDWAAFLAANAHDPTCPVVRPNFRYHPTGWELRWYKYPLRSAEASGPLTPTEWRTMIDACIASIPFFSPLGRRP